MYLKSLTLKGFKSFADRAHLEFEPGLTVIVGPNGSGKSNVSDAILWVLGEQSAKALRGQAMGDVVFAGSSARKPVALAEVDLTLDNSDHVLPVDFEEVVITRRMYRSGESEYLINGAPVRLLDITDILHDSGLGKDTRSIISQGQLDAILASRPEERRSLIEEAAGISKHKRRRERALRKLAAMDEHVRRALDVQREIARQLKPLEKQVELARKFNELSARRDELATSLAVDDLRRLKARWDQIDGEQAQATARLDVAAWQLDERRGELDKLQSLLEQRNLYVGDMAEQRRRCQSVAERVESDARLLREKGRAMATRLAELSASEERARSRNRTCIQELEEARAGRDGSQGELGALRTRNDEANERVRAAREARRVAEGALTRAQDAIRAATRERDAAAVELAKARDSLESAKVQDDLFAGRLGQINDSLARSEGEAEQIRARLEENRARLKEARQAEAASKDELARAKSDLEQAQRAQSAAHASLVDARARMGGIERVAQLGENATPLAQTLAVDAQARGLFEARVSEVLDVPEGLEALVEALLDQSLTGFVLPGDEGLARLVEHAERLGATTAGRIGMVSMEARGQAAPCDEDVPGTALLDLIGVGEGYEAAARALLGNVRLIECDAASACAYAEQFPQVRFATAQGTLYQGGCALVGNAASAASGLLEHRRQLRELAGQMPGLEAAVDEARGAVGACEEALAHAREAHEEHARAVARLGGETSSLDSEVARLEREVSKARAEAARVADQRSQAIARSDAARSQVERFDGALRAASAKLSDLEGGLDGLTSAFDAARREEREAHDEANRCQLDLARLQERAAGAKRRCEQLEREAADVARSLAEVERDRATYEARHALVGPLQERYAALAQVAAERLESVREHVGLMEADSVELRRTIDEARAALDRASHEHAGALNAVSDLKIERGRLDVQVDAAVRAITAQKGVVLEEALKLPEPADRARDEREVTRLEAQIVSIGPVNQVAFEEYEALKRRADYLDEQVEDMRHARADLDKILKAIDRKMRGSFVDTFNRVNDNFVEVFSMLFPGGSGHLEMTDPEDPDNCGIEVVAQPRGKRVAKMSLLSGGERSLTALALLFAVYRTRTVPFYVLDEVEAALDDSNLDRLLDAIEVLRKTTQLIVISHQRRTMESADVLYGVSMQADGVSHVISQKLDREAVSSWDGSKGSPRA